MSSRNIVLIGMPGAGKSTVGVLLAKSAQREFIDTDLLIQSGEARSLPQIIRDRGCDKFSEIEESYILNLHCRNTVIATGGSVVYSISAMKHLAENGVVVYLKTPFSSIRQRVDSMLDRGVVRRTGQNLQQLFQERVPLYKRWADAIVDTDNLTIPEVVSEVLKAIR